ncbi:UNVERIFIED_CONTAM: hypothetical protein HDU68_009282 [Siphonaria sp. JEL0065]|nr:hypothetical protein HDU68_009282 [Siphonaria sp. JEL0065]
MSTPENDGASLTIPLSGGGGGLRKQASRSNYHSSVPTDGAPPHYSQQHNQPSTPGIPVVTPPDDDISRHRGLGDDDVMSGMDEEKDDQITMRATTPQALLIAEANELERQYELAKASGLRRKTILLDLKDPDAPLSRLVNGGSNSDFSQKVDFVAPLEQGPASARSTPGGAGGSSAAGPGSRRMSLGVGLPQSGGMGGRRKSALSMIGDGSAINLISKQGSAIDVGGGHRQQKRQASVSFADLPSKDESGFPVSPLHHHLQQQAHLQNAGLGTGGSGSRAGSVNGSIELKVGSGNLMAPSSRQGSTLGSGNLRSDSVVGGGNDAIERVGSKRNSSINLGNLVENEPAAISTTIVNAKVPTGPNPEVLAQARALCRDRNADVLAMNKLGPGCYDPLPRIIAPAFPKCTVFKSTVPRFLVDEAELKEFSGIGPGTYAVEKFIIWNLA